MARYASDAGFEWSEPAARQEQRTSVDHQQVAESTPYLSLVIPAYNEATRIAKTIAAATAYLGAQSYRWEILVVDDGSRDDTLRVAQVASAANPNVRVIANPHRGKAFAVRSGVVRARGSIVGFTDADLSTPIETLATVLPYFGDRYDLVIGSREGSGAQRQGEPFHRHLMGRIFNALVQLIALPGIQDSQCGFKFMRSGVARALFADSLLYREGANPPTGPAVTGFDVELLFLARKRGLRIAQTPIYWCYFHSERVDPLRDSGRLLRDVLLVRWNAIRGRYG